MEELRECPFCPSGKGVAFKDNYDKYGVYCNNCNSQTGLYSTIDDAVTAWNTRPNNWISVEDKLPDTRTVLGCNIDGYVTAVVYMCYIKKWAIAHNMRATMDVTHWMPLPEPPKGVE